MSNQEFLSAKTNRFQFGLSEQECIEAIRPRLSERRFRHSVNVSVEAKRLAKRYGADVKKAEIAGLLHDIMKETPLEEQLILLSRFAIILSETEKLNKKLCHAISGATYVEHELGICDSDILASIRWHTSGRAGMSLLEKIIFVADYISADRDYKGVEEMRKLANKSLEHAIVEGIRYTVGDLLDDYAYLSEDSILAYNEALVIVKQE